MIVLMLRLLAFAIRIAPHVGSASLMKIYMMKHTQLFVKTYVMEINLSSKSTPDGPGRLNPTP